ncbi:probable inactive leucine-rich repeat receptor kinase XIAO [Malania oleifera]|uniref:probable inactive leucine-rich repeat receptor kinase XIAO n=1 Tax=Malania oleifera TaxID=397392 RepID=UPI0025AEA150|nr:probable inactive leucine-rich repeat receptor kinase XIAO [Malania oleifera]
MANLLYILILFLLTTVQKVQSRTAPLDFKALKDIRDAIKNIRPGSCVASWNFSRNAPDPCTVPRRTYFTCGVECDPTATRVIQLNLRSQSYSGSLSPSVTNLTRLQVLDLSDNSFSGSIPSLSLLSNLQSLSLGSNSFSGSFPSSITKLSSLQELDISRNKLSGSLPDDLTSLSSLTLLDLSDNKLRGSLPRLPHSLRQLALRANSLNGDLSKSSLRNLTRLETVDLAANSFSKTLPSWFFLLASLEQVNLTQNGLEGVQIGNQTGRFSKLVAIDLAFNKIKGNISPNFSTFPQLASLSLRQNLLDGPIPTQLGEMKKLQRLYLDGNFLTGIPPVKLFSKLTTGSFGDNCLQKCPRTSFLCSAPQKPASKCLKQHAEW